MGKKTFLRTVTVFIGGSHKDAVKIVEKLFECKKGGQGRACP
ncbi:MAG: hypothetical protein [Olavius algarvensis Delta 4 endosymbiont]|nr:MAG: hypothetical protein [Olavius algarvensis Delta 4 endosymbiont]